MNMTLKKIYIFALSVVLLGSCTKKLDELLVNPNGPTPESANTDLYLPVIQSNFVGVFNSASSYGQELTRQIVMYGPTYNQAYSPNSFDGVWSTAYTGVFKHANILIPTATAQKKYVQAGMAKVMKAYTMMTLVDMFGDVPYTEANLGIDNTNPNVTKGNEVYAAAIKLLQEVSDTLDLVADGKLAHGPYPGFYDNFYGVSNAAGARRWATQAKLLMIRAYMTTRLVDNGAKGKIEALLANANVVASLSGTAQDFEFKYSSKQANPNSRHPRYNGNYNGNGTTSGSAGDYIGTHFIWTMAVEKGNFSNTVANDRSDPRTRYYFYRQTTNQSGVNSSSVSCSVAAPPAQFTPNMPFCLIGFAGFWGRDHGDNSGIPPDGNFRTTWGMYPAGGEMDLNQGTRVSLNRGGQGAGVQPIWQASFSEFLRAEAVLTLGIAGDARAFLEAGVRKSISKVIGFPATIGYAVNPAVVPSQAKIDDYVNKVLTEYDAAIGSSPKLNVVMKEWYIALWGNGADANNNYRRTGMPNNFQFAKLPDAGPYIRSFLYPSSYINLNKNAGAQNAIDKKVFWDTNPAVLK
jgi:hypothetical protein